MSKNVNNDVSKDLPLGTSGMGWFLFPKENSATKQHNDRRPRHCLFQIESFMYRETVL